jgi:hypothetical protein
MKPVRTIGIRQRRWRCSRTQRCHSRCGSLSHLRPRHARLGIRKGFAGLIWPEAAKELAEESVSGILPRGGTILGTTNRGNPFAYKSTQNGKEVTHDYSSLCIENDRRLGVDAMIVTGGDGTQHIARDFFNKAVNVVGVPKTIDNDLDASEVTFGFDTAAQVIATEAIDRLHTTAESHHRDAGRIALPPALAEVLTSSCFPKSRSNSKPSATLFAPVNFVADPCGKPIPLVGPGGVANSIAFTLHEMLQKEIRVSVLGHV